MPALVRSGPLQGDWSSNLDMLCVVPVSRLFVLLAATVGVAPGCVPTAPLRAHGPKPSEEEREVPAQRAPTNQPAVERRNSDSTSIPTATTAALGQTEVHPIVGKWLLKRVVDRLTNTAFEPMRYGGLTFTLRGDVSWSDGRNGKGGKYRVVGYQLDIVGHGGGGFWTCHNYEPEDVHYDRVLSFRIDADTLTLETPQQTYVLERSR